MGSRYADFKPQRGLDTPSEEMIQVRMYGHNELRKFFKHMGFEFSTIQMRRALRRGARLIHADMIMHAPVEKGKKRYPNVPRLKESIVINTYKDRFKGEVRVRVGPNKAIKFAVPLEYGHDVPDTGGRSGYRKDLERASGKNLYSGTSLKRVAPVPFMRSSYAMQKGPAVKEIEASLGRSIKRWEGKQRRLGLPGSEAL